jgi:protein-tyrosine-phosphatase
MEGSVREAEIAPVSLSEQSEMEVEPVQALEPEEYIPPVIDQSAAIEAQPDEAEHSAIHAVETPSESAVEESASPKKLDPDDTLPSAAEQWSDLSASISERANEIAARQGLSTSEHVAHMLSSELNEAASSSVNLAHNMSPDAAMAEAQSLETKEIANAKDATLVSGTAPASTPDPALVEAVVQKVISKMSPQVVDIITREFLRPIVQALVHRAIEK